MLLFWIRIMFRCGMLSRFIFRKCLKQLSLSSLNLVSLLISIFRIFKFLGNGLIMSFLCIKFGTLIFASILIFKTLKNGSKIIEKKVKIFKCCLDQIKSESY